MDVSEEDENKDPKRDPKNCQFQSTTCGDFLPRRERLGCVTFKDLSDDVGHLFDADVYISEMDLISIRSPIPLIPNGLICGNHQFSLGIYYRPSGRCQCYLHPKTSEAKGEKVSWQLYTFVKDRDGSFILGSLICKLCKKKLRELSRESEM